MMRAGLAALLLLAAAGCAPLSGGKDVESVAQRHARVASRLEYAFMFREATMEYSIVAQHYPTSDVYPTAVLHLALLYGNQANPIRNDSLALHWIKIYLALPLGKGDRDNAQLYYSLIDRIGSLEQDLLRQTSTYDSLATAAERLGTLVPAEAKRIQELETELQRAQEELKRLKEVDIRTSKRGIH